MINQIIVTEKDVNIRSKKLRVYFDRNTPTRMHMTHIGAVQGRITHDTCICGAIKQKHINLCDKCRDDLYREKILAYPCKPWGGESMIYAEEADTFFNGVAELADYLVENESIDLDELTLWHTEPSFLPTIDFEDYYQEIPEGLSLSDVVTDKVLALMGQLNAAIKAQGSQWSTSTFIRVELSKEQLDYIRRIIAVSQYLNDH